MRALLLDGSLKIDAEIQELHSLLVSELERLGYKVENILLRDVKIAACQGNFECWVKTPGECKIHDYGRDIATKMVQSNLIIHFTPITFGGYSSELKKAIDRFIPTILPFFVKRKGETHHTYRYQSRASIIALGYLNSFDEEQEAIFKELVYRNSLNMGSPIHESIIYIKNQDKSGFMGEFSSILKKVEELV
ncbi:MAG: NAD(P)H-dependent oxidoreductase [Promethearchaeota archaeon]|jgi:multimeric flavodoxin WrbA